MTVLTWAWFGHIPEVLQFLILLAGALGALGIIHKYVFKPVKTWVSKVGDSADLIGGVEAKVDPTTGQIKEAVPPLANRVYALEQAQVQTASALDRIADAIERMGEFDQRLMAVTERLEAHEVEAHQWADEHDKWIRSWIDEHNALHMIVDDKSIQSPDPS